MLLEEPEEGECTQLDEVATRNGGPLQDRKEATDE